MLKGIHIEKGANWYGENAFNRGKGYAITNFDDRILIIDPVKMQMEFIELPEIQHDESKMYYKRYDKDEKYYVDTWWGWDTDKYDKQVFEFLDPESQTVFCVSLDNGIDIEEVE